MDFEYIKRWAPYTFFVSFMTNNTDISIYAIITYKSKAKLRISIHISCSNATGAMLTTKSYYFDIKMSFQYLYNSKIQGFSDLTMKRPGKSRFSMQTLAITQGCYFYFFLNYCPVVITKTWVMLLALDPALLSTVKIFVLAAILVPTSCHVD